MNNLGHFLNKTRLLFIALLLIIVGNIFLIAKANAQIPVSVTADATATVIATKSWMEEAWVYLCNKVSSIFFQNIFRRSVCLSEPI